MKIITVSDETKRLIDAQVQRGHDLRQTAIRLPEGRWTILVDDEVFDHIATARLPGETDDDVVSRLLRAPSARSRARGTLSDKRKAVDHQSTISGH